MIRRPPRSTLDRSSAASDVYKRQGLFLLGIEYAIILGITGALLNVIPYIGGVVAIALPMIIAFVTKDSYSYSILVLIIYVIIPVSYTHLRAHETVLDLVCRLLL